MTFHSRFGSSKRMKVELGSGLSVRVMPHVAPRRRQKLVRNTYPLWGGIANSNLSWLSGLPAGPVISDYLRAVSTGPVGPLILSVTTYDQAINVGVSYRTTVYPEPTAARLIDELSRCLHHPTES